MTAHLFMGEAQAMYSPEDRPPVPLKPLSPEDFAERCAALEAREEKMRQQKEDLLKARAEAVKVFKPSGDPVDPLSTSLQEAVKSGAASPALDALAHANRATAYPPEAYLQGLRKKEEELRKEEERLQREKEDLAWDMGQKGGL